MFDVWTVDCVLSLGNIIGPEWLVIGNSTLHYFLKADGLSQLDKAKPPGMSSKLYGPEPLVSSDFLRCRQFIWSAEVCQHCAFLCGVLNPQN